MRTRDILQESCRAAMTDIRRARAYKDRQAAREYRRLVLLEAMTGYGYDFALDLAGRYGGAEDILSSARILEAKKNPCTDLHSVQGQEGAAQSNR